MANISPRKNKHGEIISYRIRVARGYDSNEKKIKPHEMTWKPAPNMTAKQIQKELQKQAVLFEEQCRQGLTGGGRQKFDAYAKYVIELKEKLAQSGLRKNSDKAVLKSAEKLLELMLSDYRECFIKEQAEYP